MSQDEEIYHFMNDQFHISAILTHIKTGKLRPKLIEISPEFVTEFAEKVQCLRRGIPAKDQRVGMFSSINTVHAMTLSDARLEEPLIFVHTRKGKGMLNMDGKGLNYLLGDGQHRLARAYMDGRQTPLKAYVLSETQSRKYRF